MLFGKRHTFFCHNKAWFEIISGYFMNEQLIVCWLVLCVCVTKNGSIFNSTIQWTEPKQNNYYIHRSLHYLSVGSLRSRALISNQTNWMSEWVIKKGIHIHMKLQWWRRRRWNFIAFLNASQLIEAINFYYIIVIVSLKCQKHMI